MKSTVLSGSAIAVSAVALVLAGSTPAAAKHHHHHHHKYKAEKQSCNAKASCKGAATPSEPAAPASK